MTTRKKTKKKVAREWPRNLKKKELLEQFQDIQCEIDNLENESHELELELKRRDIDPWENV